MSLLELGNLVLVVLLLLGESLVPLLLEVLKLLLLLLFQLDTLLLVLLEDPIQLVLSILHLQLLDSSLSVVSLNKVAFAFTVTNVFLQDGDVVLKFATLGHVNGATSVLLWAICSRRHYQILEK